MARGSQILIKVYIQSDWLVRRNILPPLTLEVDWDWLRECLIICTIFCTSRGAAGTNTGTLGESKITIKLNNYIACHCTTVIYIIYTQLACTFQ